MDNKYAPATAPVRIFDSRQAQKLYGNYAHYRSSDFFVPPGYIGLVEIIAAEEYLKQMTFSAIRIPTPQKGEGADCYLDCNTGKRYRRWKCQQSLGTPTSPAPKGTTFTEYNSSIVFWGLDPFTQDIVEFEYIVRPGHYFLEANRCINEVLDDCINPTIIEFSLIRSDDIYDLLLPCNENYAYYWDDEIRRVPQTGIVTPGEQGEP